MGIIKQNKNKSNLRNTHTSYKYKNVNDTVKKFYQ